MIEWAGIEFDPDVVSRFLRAPLQSPHAAEV